MSKSGGQEEFQQPKTPNLVLTLTLSSLNNIDHASFEAYILCLIDYFSHWKCVSVNMGLGVSSVFLFNFHEATDFDFSNNLP